MMTELSQAQVFATLRSVWLMLKHTPFGDQLRPAFRMCTPTYVPDGQTGDSDCVLFSDGSTLVLDWDNGDLRLGDKRIEYPWDKDDILFTLKSPMKEESPS